MGGRNWLSRAGGPAACAFGVAVLAFAGRGRPDRDAAPPPRPTVTTVSPAHPDVLLLAVRTAAMDVVAGELLAGRLSLAGAAAVADWLDDRLPPDRRTPAADWRFPRLGHAAADRPWLLAMNAVMGRVESRTPDREGEVAAALEDEFRAERACGRPPRPPAVRPGDCERLVAYAEAAVEHDRRGEPRPPSAALRLVEPEGG